MFRRTLLAHLGPIGAIVPDREERRRRRAARDRSDADERSDDVGSAGDGHPADDGHGTDGHPADDASVPDRGHCPARRRHSPTSTAVVDRVADGEAVVLFEDDDFQRTVPVEVLPPDAREDGVVLAVPADGALATATVDRTATQERRQSAQDRFDDLAERPDDG